MTKKLKSLYVLSLANLSPAESCESFSEDNYYKFQHIKQSKNYKGNSLQEYEEWLVDYLRAYNQNITENTKK